MILNISGVHQENAVKQIEELRHVDSMVMARLAALQQQHNVRRDSLNLIVAVAGVIIAFAGVVIAIIALKR